MHEERKLREARHFLVLLSQQRALGRQEFENYLSAFLSASRSVLQYALKEAQTRPGGQAWYDAQIAASSISKFVKCKRDINIHVEPISPAQQITEVGSIIIHLLPSAEDEQVGEKPKADQVTLEGGDVERKTPGRVEVVVDRYHFVDWGGPEDVLDLCKACISELEKIVEDGKRNGILTG